MRDELKTSPCSLLKKELKDRRLTQKELAEALGISTSYMSDMMNVRRPITIEIARKIESLLGLSATALMTQQVTSQIRNKQSDEERSAEDVLQEYDKYVCVKSLLQVNKLCKMSFVEQLQLLKEKYNILEPPIALQHFMSNLSNRCFRRSEKAGLDTRMIATWIVKAEAEGLQYHQPLVPFTMSSRNQVVGTLRSILHTNRNTLPLITDVLKNNGIGFTIVEKEKYASVDGYSFMREGHPYIIITCRYNRIDNLAFTVLHELGHIYLGHTTEGCQQINIESRDNFWDGEVMCHEKEADEFATDALIPNNIWKFVPTVPLLNPIVIQRRYTEWAVDRGLNKWIVLGRISHETGMYYFKSDNTRYIDGYTSQTQGGK